MRKLALLSLLLLATPAAAQRLCTSNTYALGCGPTLTGTFEPIGGGSNLLVLRARGLFPHAPGGMVWGFDQIQVPILGNCLLHTRAIWSTTFVSDAQGNHVWQRAWPASIDGFFRIQMGTLQVQPFNVKVTNAILADCSVQ